MNSLSKPYVHLPIDAVNTVVFDPEGDFDGEQFDRYPSFAEARRRVVEHRDHAR